MARLTPRFSANRTVREYTEQHYLPAALATEEETMKKATAITGVFLGIGGVLLTNRSKARIGRVSTRLRRLARRFQLRTCG